MKSENILHYSGTDPVEKKKLEIEQEAWRTFDALTGDIKDKVEKLAQELYDSKKALSEKDLALSEKDMALSEKDLALSEMSRQLEELKRRLDEK